MDRERLAQLLEEPGKVSKEDLSDLKALTERFPWFSGAHLLRAVGEQAGGDVMADRSLHNSVAHLPSRAVLFDLRDISMQQAAAELRLEHATSGPSAVIEEQEEHGSKAEPETTMTVVPSVDEGQLPAEISDAIPGQDEHTEEESVSIDTVLERSQAEQEGREQEPTETAEPVDAEAVPVETLDHKETDPEVAEERNAEASPEELDRQIMEAALASAYDLTWQEQLKAQKRELETTRAQVVLPSAEAPAKSSVDAGTASLSPMPAEPAAKITPNARLKFTDWLSASAPAEQTSLPPGAAPKLEKSAQAEMASAEEPEQPSAPAPAVLDTKTIIERFIEHETPAPVRKAEFYTPQQAAKKSLDDSAGMVSETLAKIYEKQGNLPKAIEAYRKLALKYPEKSAYFAALSKSLEGKSNA